jgi:hypothetical protein
MGWPIATVSSIPSFSALASIKAASLFMCLALSVAGVFLHDLNAFVAASTARSISTSSATFTFEVTKESSYGLMIVSFSLDVEVINYLLVNIEI